MHKSRLFLPNLQIIVLGVIGISREEFVLRGRIAGFHERYIPFAEALSQRHSDSDAPKIMGKRVFALLDIPPPRQKVVNLPPKFTYP